MESIIQIKGKVNFQITLDSTVWIFDDRKLNLETYFIEKPVEVDPDEEYIEKAGKFWSREIMEGATFPPTLKTERKFDRKDMMTGTFGIKIEPFILNAEPKEDAKTVVFETHDGSQYRFSIEDAKKLIFQFSKDGKMLKENGPVYLLLGDGSNYENPIKGIVGMQVE
ncbi:peptidyl-prolyl cis-trans isomerase [Rummeliibacillus pycnus]|uniref:peptidyl-prolyl cis-trans isomerase n=1 Tax=Rummeliibacillus pycnus TaxID=101070 RepID=UPI003D29911F